MIVDYFMLLQINVYFDWENMIKVSLHKKGTEWLISVMQTKVACGHGGLSAVKSPIHRPAATQSGQKVARAVAVCLFWG
jgi:hypothetical protein